MPRSKRIRRILKKKKTKKSKKNQRGGSDDVGFIVTRCVKKEEQNILYHDCYAAIRKFYPHLKIVFIDDNSDKNLLKEIPMENVEIIQSEFPAAGEFLPYYYLVTRNLFKKAIIIMDSMIINTPIPYDDVTDYMYLYEFGSPGKEENVDKVEILLKNTKKPNELLQSYKDNKWMGCFGSCMVITYDFLKEIEDTVGITQWKTIINNRDFRMGLERSIGVVCAYIKPKEKNYSLFGNFYDMQVLGENPGGIYGINEYLEDKSRIKYSIIKIFNKR